MIPLIIAAAIATTPHIQLYPIQTLSADQREATAEVCADLIFGKVSMQQLADSLKLDTKDKQQGLVFTCTMYAKGLQDGINAEVAAHQNAPHGTMPINKNYKAMETK